MYSVNRNSYDLEIVIINQLQYNINTSINFLCYLQCVMFLMHIKMSRYSILTCKIHMLILYVIYYLLLLSATFIYLQLYTKTSFFYNFCSQIEQKQYVHNPTHTHAHRHTLIQ
jgi:hypothetical protein